MWFPHIAIDFVFVLDMVILYFLAISFKFFNNKNYILQYSVFLGDTTLRELGKGKGEINPRTGHEASQRKWSPSSSFNLGARLRWVVNATPRPLWLFKETGTKYTEGWGEGAQDRVRKISLLPVFEPRTVEPVANCYTDCALAAPFCMGIEVKHVCRIDFWYLKGASLCTKTDIITNTNQQCVHVSKYFAK